MVQPGSGRLIIGPGTAGMRGRGVIERFLLAPCWPNPAMVHYFVPTMQRATPGILTWPSAS
jgi:hypothetical protein